jgi:hypothetical protein
VNSVLREVRIAWIAAFLMTAVLPSSAWAFPDGFADGATDCGGCHGNSATSSVGVSISGPSTLAPDATGNYTLTIDMALAGGALDVAITSGEGGTLGAVDGNTKILSGEVVHVDAFSDVGMDGTSGGNIGDWLYNFAVTAPSTIGAMITVAAVGMQFNGDFAATAADLWNNATSFDITVVPEPATGLLMAGGLLILAAGRRRSRT